MTIRKDDNKSFIDDAIRLVKIALAYTFKEARLATTGGSDLEHIKDVGQVSTILTLITNSDGDLLYGFDEMKEIENKKTTLKNTN